MSYYELQDLLSNSDFNTTEDEKVDNCKYPHGGTAKDMQRANKNASLYDFLDMLSKIVRYVMKEDKVEFVTNELETLIKDPSLPLNHPIITYKIISRKPKNEYKPIIRENTNECDEYNQQRGGIVLGQTFDCIVQFNIFAAENRLVNKVMEKFEELILTYTGYFKEQGVRELYFQEELTDSDYNNFRETLSVKNLNYYVQIEKLTVIFNHRIDDILVSGDAVETKNNK